MIKLPFSFLAVLLLSSALACDKHVEDHRHLHEDHEEHAGDRHLKHGSRCGTPDLTPAQQRSERAAIAEFRTRNSKRMAGPCLGTVNIETVVAVIHDGSRGKLAASAITAQMDVLNAAYASHGFAFNLRETRFIENASWLTGCLNEGFKTTVRSQIDPSNADGKDVLYMYTCDPADGVLGYATFPSDDVGTLDGVVLGYGSLPGGPNPPYNLGDTATHEVSCSTTVCVSISSSFDPTFPRLVCYYVLFDSILQVGHWLGLYHTFQDGCAGGDEVADTPAEADPAFGCPVGRDTCPGTGTDPIRNFMDYSVCFIYLIFTSL